VTANLDVTPPTTRTPSVDRLADRLYRNPDLPAETSSVRREARKIAEELVAPVAHRLANQDEREHGFPHETFDQLGKAGLFRVPFQKDVGGAGLIHRATATATVVEELAYFSNSVAAIFDVHCILAGNALDQGNPEQRKRWLAPIVDGSIVGAFATSEPDASSDLSAGAVQTVAVRDSDGWILNGRKRWITNSTAAAVIVVLTRTDDRLTTFIVPTDRPGVTIGNPDRKLGNRAQITADVILDGVRLDDSLVLGEPGRGLAVALQALTYGRIGIAAAGVGMAQAAFDRTAAHLASRSVFGSLLGAKQHWQFLMARRATQLETARSLYLKAALRLDAGEPFPEPEAAMAKLVGTELAVDMGRDAVQAFGGLGFTVERGADDLPGPVEAIYRDSKIGEIYEGANEVQQWVIARQIFGREITG
jgi:alkylation response protein AidB-like acyl-CoA dehydrogenase